MHLSWIGRTQPLVLSCARQRPAFVTGANCTVLRRKKMRVPLLLAEISAKRREMSQVG